MRTALLFAFFCAAFVAPAAAETAVFVSANRLSVDLAHERATFSGNVVVDHGPARLKASVVTVQYGADFSRIESYAASGAIALETDGKTLSGATAFFHPALDMLTLTGSLAVLKPAQTSPIVVIDVDTDNQEALAIVAE